jgi:DNA-binding NarL/FixJ family response regulator
MTTVIAVVSDLIFSTKITGTGKALGRPVSVARTIERLREFLAASEKSDNKLVIVDLNVSGPDPMTAIREAKSDGAQVIAYLSHVQADLAAAARDAGADQVMARSAFTDQLPQLLSS